jgi:hypothetical protein
MTDRDDRSIPPEGDDAKPGRRRLTRRDAGLSHGRAA